MLGEVLQAQLVAQVFVKVGIGVATIPERLQVQLDLVGGVSFPQKLVLGRRDSASAVKAIQTLVRAGKCFEVRFSALRLMKACRVSTNAIRLPPRKGL